MENIVEKIELNGIELSEMPDILWSQERQKRRILFVCTGNTCRSPMTAAVYNDRFAGDDSEAVSAGLAADGSGISKNAVLALTGEGIHPRPGNDFLVHVSHTVTEEDIDKADLVVGITNRHAMSLLFAFPSAAGKITSLPKDIKDPFGGDEATYRACLKQIQQALEKMFVQNHGFAGENSDTSKDT